MNIHSVTSQTNHSPAIVDTKNNRVTCKAATGRECFRGLEGGGEGKVTWTVYFGWPVQRGVSQIPEFREMLLTFTGVLGRADSFACPITYVVVLVERRRRRRTQRQNRTFFRKSPLDSHVSGNTSLPYTIHVQDRDTVQHTHTRHTREWERAINDQRYLVCGSSRGNPKAPTHV